MKCEECLSLEATNICIECEQVLCKDCDEILHKGGKRKTHARPLICGECRDRAVIQCIQCNLSLCHNCQQFHSSHIIKHIASSKRLGVFWDISSCRPSKSEDIQILLNEINQKVGNPEFIKAYGDPWGKWKDALSTSSVLSVNKAGIKTFESLLLDLSISLNTGLTHILIISTQSQTFVPHLMQLKSNMTTVEFWLSSRILPLQIQEALTEGVKKNKNSQLDIMINYLREEAFKGNILIELQELIQILELKMKIINDEVSRLLEQAEKSGLIYFSCKEFDKETINFVSLRVDNCTLECLTWTLRSLCVDEMLPSEKAIQARIREVFDYKPSDSEWQNLISQARGHSHASSAPEFSLFSKSPTLPKFTFKEINDPSSGNKTLAIYPNGELWEALDNHSKFGDFLDIKKTQEWKDFLSFLENYFVHKGFRRPKKDEGQKTIPGGRYGCAQFIKVCGPNSLKNCSLGKLSYMVQLAISEDYLRYQRTLLIWTANTHNFVPKNELNKKIQGIKQATLSILEKYSEGVSLAQLPLYIKRSLNFPLNIQELGYPKLKDLLATFPEVSIELRNTNHPFAILCKDNKYTTPPLIENILFCITNILSDKNFGIEVRDLEAQIVFKLGRIEWVYYKTLSLGDFIRAHGKNQFEIVKTRDTFMIFKAKQHCYSYFYEPIGEDSWDFQNDRVSSPTVLHHSSLSSEPYPGHIPRALNVSDLPVDFIRPNAEEPNYFFDSGTSSTDFSYSLTRYKRENGESQSKFPFAEHIHIKSEDLGNRLRSSDRDSYSWLDYSSLRPPPGFE
ncbi:hypothetical protein SteCoe_21115 [Stentor coeruleus]|uniref:B box-type domain-containing protein n=1 Tax=Stentor coeruleus TaxID=5963 RepID=A0A1R2BQD1_9CILI|nr:hypothetical protein SteCoe_21115 [Stentor coeruleus]